MDPQNQAQAPIQPDTPVEENNQEADVQQQVADRLLSSKSVLVTVSANPSVDELASALGLTMILNKLSKHVTTVFSGKVPSAMEFLDPEATFEDNVDSLRDFIIALDKEKADKLRYKVEEDVVKIFITPYQTVITENDLQFSQGDFNVDVVMALGVLKNESLDAAILAHGGILHDAQVITVTAGKKSNLGSIDWNDDKVSSISEMLVQLSSKLGENLIDEQVGTALLTGIVAETNRFSNEKTSPSVMTIAAQLMAAGANQQLVATNLRQEGMISESIRTKNTEKSQNSDDGGEMVLNHQSKKDQKDQQAVKQKNQFTDKSNRTNSNDLNNAPKNVSNDKTSNQQVTQTKPDTNNQSDNRQQDKSTGTVSVTEKVTEVESKPSESSHKPKVINPLPTTDDQTDNQSSAQPAATTEPATKPEETESEQNNLPKIQTEKAPSITAPPQFGGTLNATVNNQSDDEDAVDPLSAKPAPLFEHGDRSDDHSNAEAIEDARKAIEDASSEPVESTQNEPLPPVAPYIPPVSMPSQPVATPVPEPTPVDDFMQPHVDNSFSPSTMNPLNATTQPTVAMDQNQMPAMPPLPPMPGPSNNGLPPLPPMPPLPGTPSDDAVSFQPQINPEFMDSVNQSQNQITNDGQQLTDKYAQRDEVRQQKIDELGASYDSAVEKNREIQGLPPTNDHTTFPLPPPPQK